MQEPLQHLVELVLQFFKVLLFFAAMVLPATWVCLQRLPSLSIVGRLALGAALGFSLFVVEAWYVGLWSLDWLIAIWVAHYVVATWFGLRPGHSVAAAAPASTGRPGWHYRLVPLPLAAAVLLQLYALQFSKLPPGVDSSFHCAVAQRQLDGGRATMDLWPLESLKLNYPIGSHLWLAVAARWTGLEVHEIFRHSFALALCGAALCVGAWTEKLFGSPGHAAAGVFAFVFASYQASFFPYTWGGLPSAFAMWLALAALFCVLYIPGRVGVALGSLLFGSTALTHHHSMLAVLGGTGCVALIGWIWCTEHRAVARRLLVSLVGSAVVAGVYVVPLAGRLVSVGDTAILGYAEPFSWPWLELWSWGPALLIAAGLGFAARGQADSGAGRRVLFSLALLWLICFVFLDYGHRIVAYWHGVVATTPFTPSRFLFDVQFVAAIFAGGGLWRLWEWLRRPAFRYALVAGVVCWGIWRTAPRWDALPSDMLLLVGRWARSNLPEDALVTGPPNPWLTYLCRRESTSMFVPISESARSTRREIKDILLHAPHRLSADQWQSQLGKPVYFIGSVRDESWESAPVFVAEPIAVYDMNSSGWGR